MLCSVGSLTYLVRTVLVRKLHLLSKRFIKQLMDGVTPDLYQTELIIVPFPNPLIRSERLSCAGALLGKQSRRQSGSSTFSDFQSNGKPFQSDPSICDGA